MSRGPAADVCLLLEGTYPFVRGGVSSWVHQLITGLPELRFSLVFIGGRRNDYGQMRYTLPPNVVHLECHFLEDAYRDIKPTRMRERAERFSDERTLHRFLQMLATGYGCPASQAAELHASVDATLRTLSTSRGLSLLEFLSSPCSWQQIRESHLARDPNAAFVDYFWTLRLMHGPLFQLAGIAENIPEAGAFHAISTGYAGFLGALLECRRQRPLLLSEHGIYTKERRIDLNQADWFDTLHEQAPGGGAGLRDLWIRYFESLGRLTYRAANPIISLYTGNRERQHKDGAPSERTRIIVNGIDAARFRSVRKPRGSPVPNVIGLLGRVVPIKDVKTFVRALQLVIATLPDTEGWIIGSAEEDPGYGEECEALARSLGLGDKLRFLGHRDVFEIFPQLGLLMLTSISEAQPLAILEAFAAGVPCVATDVGACREEIEGGRPEDRALGRAGRVVPFADAAALAGAAIELLSSADAYRACQAAAIARVERYYTLQTMIDQYRGLYTSALRA